MALSPTSLNMSLDTSLNTPLAAKIQSTKLSLYNKDTEPYSPFMKITLPELNVNHKTETSVVNQTVHIDDLDELIKWFNGVFDEPEVKVSVKGDPTVKLSTLTYHPHLNTDVKVKSLDYLAGFGVNEMEFVLPPKENGFNLKGTLNLPNSGSLELFLGNLTFNMMSGNVNLGYANLYNVDMKPGNNTPYFDGEFFFNELIPNLGTILDAQKEALSRGVIAFNATGNSTTINGEHIMYVEKVLNAKHIPYEIPVTTLLSSLVNGLMGDGKSDLLDLAGDLVGNKTLLDNILEHWNETNPTGNGESIGKKVKRVVPNASLMWNMIRLSNRVKKHEL